MAQWALSLPHYHHSSLWLVCAFSACLQTCPGFFASQTTSPVSLLSFKAKLLKWFPFHHCSLLKFLKSIIWPYQCTETSLSKVNIFHVTVKPKVLFPRLNPALLLCCIWHISLLLSSICFPLLASVKGLSPGSPLTCWTDPCHSPLLFSSSVS